MKEKNKGRNIAIMVICILVYLFVYMLMGPLRRTPQLAFLSDYMGVLSAFLVLITTTLVTTNGKRGYIASAILCSLSISSAASSVLRSHTVTGLPGVFTPIVNMVAMTVILTFLTTNRKQTQELSEQYEQIMDSNRLMQEKDEALKTLAYKDEMTDMYNAVYFNEQMEILLNQNMPFKIIYMDLDNFKNVNDTFGPEVGDSVLKSYASRISKYCGENYLCARTGGDDFGILLTGEPTQADVLNLVEQIRRIFAEPLTVQGANISLTASYGVAGSPNDGKTTDILLDNAIMAVYNAKASGKDRPCFFSQP